MAEPESFEYVRPWRAGTIHIRVVGQVEMSESGKDCTVSTIDDGVVVVVQSETKEEAAENCNVT
jgi:hypothetical protein